MANRILLKNIYIEKFYTPKEVEQTLPTISVSDNDNFWLNLEKDIVQISKNNFEKSNCACWNCSLFFDEKPYNIPIFLYRDIIKTDHNTTSEYIEITDFKNLPHHVLLDSVSRAEQITVKYYGNFCSIFCALRFLTETIEIPPQLKEHYKNMLYMLYGEEIKKDISYIPLAHSKTIMKSYNDKGISEQDYKNLNKSLYKLIF